MRGDERYMQATSLAPSMSATTCLSVCKSTPANFTLTKALGSRSAGTISSLENRSTFFAFSLTSMKVVIACVHLNIPLGQTILQASKSVAPEDFLRLLRHHKRQPDFSGSQVVVEVRPVEDSVESLKDSSRPVICVEVYSKSFSQISGDAKQKVPRCRD
jgi:hypothetical protein